MSNPAPPKTSLNPEKLRILDLKGNVLVVANPGTGKTLLLAHRYAQLVRDGVKPEEILCLTYTNKAEDEMRQAIGKALLEDGLQFDYSKINVRNFHSYALEEIGEQERISNDLLRYAIFRHLTENKVLNYEGEYLTSTIIPKIEDSVRYLKSFGVMPDDIDLREVQRLLTDYKTQTKEEMDKYAAAYLDMFSTYETTKAGRGVDYADMLLEFMKMKAKPHFEHVLVDELQDVSDIEAEIALQSCKTFFVVGDKKQAIFAFQGGSVLNFKKFEEGSSRRVLSENFRSTNEILDYAKEFFSRNTSDKKSAEETRDLRNNEKEPGPRPKIYGVAREDVVPLACQLVQQIGSKGLRVAVIARTNRRIGEISKELERRGIEHSSTSYEASSDAQEYIVKFLLGLFSNRMDDVRNAMMTPFFPISLQGAFELSQMEDKELREQLPIRCPEYLRMKREFRTVPDVDRLFEKRLIPTALAYGREYFLAALGLQKVFAESMHVLKRADLDSVAAYLRSCDLTPDESQKDKDVVLTTVHKAKGRQFEAVVYLPERPRDHENFNDEVVKRILETKKVNVEEELAEEPIRIDFVAITRAMDELHIVTDHADDYRNECADIAGSDELKLEGLERTNVSDRYKRAFNLFVSGDTKRSKELLETKNRWLIDFVKDWFGQLDHVSPTWLPQSGDEEDSTQGFLEDKILGLERGSGAQTLGGKVHMAAEAVVLGEELTADREIVPYVDNIRKLTAEIQKKYPTVVAAEQEIVIPLKGIVRDDAGLLFKGKIDVVFCDQVGSYLIVDWKTDKKRGNASQHRQQLEAYRRAYSVSAGVPLDRIKVAIGFVGLRTTVNLGRVGVDLDDMQPGRTAFETFEKRVSRVVEWKKDPEKFLRDLGEGSDEAICRAVQEEFKLER